MCASEISYYMCIEYVLENISLTCIHTIISFPCSFVHTLSTPLCTRAHLSSVECFAAANSYQQSASNIHSEQMHANPRTAQIFDVAATTEAIGNKIQIWNRCVRIYARRKRKSRCCNDWRNSNTILVTDSRLQRSVTRFE